MVKLWTHEVLRVFHDRLTDNTDRIWMGKMVCELLDKHFKEKGTTVMAIKSTSAEDLIVGMRGILFADFMVPGADPKLYKWGLCEYDSFRNVSRAADCFY
jgi:dynein heavy chain, axonemal